MSVSQTSVENYHRHRDSGDLGHQCSLLLAAMVAGRGYSRAELAEASGVRLSSVCGRVNEMVEAGQLVEGSKRACRVTGRTVGTVVRPAGGKQLGLL